MNASRRRSEASPKATLRARLVRVRLEVGAARAWRWLARWGWPLAGGLALALGWIGFLQQNGAASLGNWVDAFLSTLQLFVLNVPAADLPGWPGRIAGLLAPLATGGAVIQAFGERFARERELLGLWRHPARDVFIGGGDTATGIAIRRHEALTRAARRVRNGKHVTAALDALAQAARRQPKLVGLDPAEESALARAFEGFDLRAFVLRGDALATGALEPLRLHRSQNVWISTGDDFRNLEIARRVLDAIGREAAHGDRPTRLLISLRDRHLTRARQVLFPAARAPVHAEIEFFSLARMAARALLLDPKLLPCPATGSRNVHLLVFGAGELAETIVLQAVQHLVHDDDPANCVRISLAGRGARALLTGLRERFPALAPTSSDPALAAILPLARITAIEDDSADLVVDDWRRLQANQRFDLICVATDRDLVTVGAALRIAALRDLDGDATGHCPPIVCCLQQPTGSVCALSPSSAGVDADDLADDANGLALLSKIHRMHRFDVFESCIRPEESYPGEHQDRHAMLVNGVYHGLSGRDLIDRAALKWSEERIDAFRWSSRLAADHIDVKLGLIRRASAQAPAPAATATATRETGDPPVADGAEAVAAQVEAALGNPALRLELARIEHRRFVVERLLDGWLPAPAGKSGTPAAVSGLDARDQKNLLRLNPTLRPFDELDEDARAPAFAIVDAIPSILRAAQCLPKADGPQAD